MNSWSLSDDDVNKHRYINKIAFYTWLLNTGYTQVIIFREHIYDINVLDNEFLDIGFTYLK